MYYLQRTFLVQMIGNKRVLQDWEMESNNIFLGINIKLTKINFLFFSIKNMIKILDLY